MDEAGDVGELAVRNPLDLGVLLYDGEELVGAKQNRILNVSVLLAAGSTTRIPVSCVERGRWSSRGRRFRSAGHVAGAGAAAAKAASLRTDALARGAAQRGVGERRPAAGGARRRSPTAANSDGFAAREPRDPRPLAALRARAGPERRARLDRRPGLVPGRGVAAGGVRADYPKLLAGYVYDAIDADRAR